MTSNTRRPGFRLWGGDSADEPEEQQTGQQPAAAEPAEASASQPAAPETEPQLADAETASAQPAAADTSPEPAEDATGFLASLVNAMRSVAEEARDSSLADFRQSVEQRIGELETEAAERAEDLRRQADEDISTIGDWQRSEIERIKSEAEQRTEARRSQLDHQLTDHRTASEQQVANVRGKLAEHEEELTAFFAQLSDIHDPGAFVAAAKRMPRPPQIAGATAAAPSAPRQTLDMRLAALGVDREEAAATADEAATPAESAAEPATEPATEPAPQESASQAPAETDAEPATPTVDSAPEASDAAQPEAAVSEPAASEVTPAETVGEDAARDAQLTDRLAQLDSQLSGAAAPAPAPQNGATEAAPGGETSTAIVVKGLGSFGAITSFKQALERVDGILGVTLSLGPTGEFVYRASHSADFDLVAAVRSVEGAGAQIERDDGTLRVSVNRNR